MRVQPHEAGAAHGGPELRLPAEQDEERMDVADDHPAAGTDHPRQLGNRAADLGQMHERERTDDGIDRGGLQRQRLEIALAKRALRQILPRLGQHRDRAVDADHPMPALGQILAVAPGPARGIQRDTGRERIEQGAHRWILDREQPQRLVVSL